jgi:hypothetical protein
MSRAEYFSKTPPVFTKLAVRLRMIPAVAFVFARFAALLRGNSGRGEAVTSEFSGEAPDATSNTVDQDAAVSKPSGIQAIPSRKSMTGRSGKSSFAGAGPRPGS